MRRTNRSASSRTPTRGATLIGAAAAALAIAGCDKTVGLDNTRPSFSDVLVPGACKVGNSLTEVDVSVLLLARAQGLLPEDRLAGESQLVGQQLSARDFQFTQTGTGSDLSGNVVASGETSGSRLGAEFRPVELRYDFLGGEARRADDKLIILLLDHSGSLIGRDAFTGAVDVTKASDRQDQRFVFFQQLINNLPERDFLSLIWFQGAATRISGNEYAQPTRNRDLIREGLDELQNVENKEGETPLADALDRTLTTIALADSVSDLNPVVILFTDGVEAGDNSVRDLSEVRQSYVNAGVPVLVLQLQPVVASEWPRGRDPALVELACATGGEYLFIEQPDEFTINDDLEKTVRNRLAGAWKLRAETTLERPEFASDNYFIEAELSVTLARRSRTAALSRARDTGLDFNDTRLWFQKP